MTTFYRAGPCATWLGICEYDGQGRYVWHEDWPKRSTAWRQLSVPLQEKIDSLWWIEANDLDPLLRVQEGL